jgi:hypothetical protein
MYRYKWNTAPLALAVAIGMAPVASGQSLWTDQSGDRAVSVELMRPEFSGKDHADFMTSVMYLSGRFSIGQNAAAEIELPYARYGYSSDYGDHSESGVGNPYIGVRVNGEQITSRVGVRIPVASTGDGDALSVGIISDYDRFEAFLPDVASLTASIARPSRLSDQVTLSFGAGPVLTVYTKDTQGDQVELFAQYFLLSAWEGAKVQVKAGFTGRALITEGNLSFADRSIHQFGIQAGLNSGTFRPGVHFRLPIDNDLGDAIDYVAGLNFTVVLD